MLLRLARLPTMHNCEAASVSRGTRSSHASSQRDCLSSRDKECIVRLPVGSFSHLATTTMKLQCPSCHKLALCDPGSGKSTGWVNRVAFADLVQGKGEGCTGCRLICEILPLLNDYREGPYGVPNLFVYSTGYGFTVESVVTLRSGTLKRIGLGIFELCKMNGAW